MPLKWGGAPIKMSSSNHEQMACVKPQDLLMAIKWGVPTIACNPPATSGMGRHLGKPNWHGDSHYKRFWPVASKVFQPLTEQRRPWDVPGFDRKDKLLA